MDFDHPWLRDVVVDVVVAGGAGGLVAGVPSSVHALATRSSPIEATVAAGTLLLPGERRPLVLMAAALPVHAALSMGWAAVLAAILPAAPPAPPRRLAAAARAIPADAAPTGPVPTRPVSTRTALAGTAAIGAATGAAAGLVIAAVDLGLVARRFPRIRALPILPQVADHVAYGFTVGLVLARRRERRRRSARHGTNGPNIARRSGS